MSATAFLSESDNFPLIDAEAEDAVRAFRLLGGRKVIKQTVRNSLDAHDVIVKGCCISLTLCRCCRRAMR